MTHSNTHLHFNGDCLRALKFYEKAFGGKVLFSMTWGESPAAGKTSAAWKKKIIHSSFEAPGLSLSAVDVPQGTYKKPRGFETYVQFDKVAQARTAFRKLSPGAKIRMPFAKSFWSPGFGMLTDRFGIPWMIGTAQKA